MRETELQKRCLEWVAKNYRGVLLAVNIHGGGYSNKGFPDLLVFGRGKAVAIELKADSGYRFQPDQQVWRNRFAKVGVSHHVLDTIEDFKETIKEEFDEDQSED